MLDEPKLTHFQAKLLCQVLLVASAQFNLKDIEDIVRAKMVDMTLIKAISILKHKHELKAFLSAPVKGIKRSKKPRPSESKCKTAIDHLLDEVFLLAVEGELI